MSAGAAKSAEAAPSAEGGDAPAAPKRRNKKLMLILAVVALVVLVLGAGITVAVVKMKAQRAAAAAAEDTDDDTAAAEEAAEREHKKSERAKHPPAYLPLDPFTVNLADREQDRYAQIGITFEIDDAKAGEQMKAVMPAMRSGILMILAHKSSQDLLERNGKEKLATEIMREALRPLGIEDENESPIRSVLFSSFIIQ